MKKKTHPPYQDVLFVDTATGHKFVCGSTLQPKEKAEFEGKEYPVFTVPVSSASHPFFTGSQQFLDAEGMVDKFTKKYAKKKQENILAKEKQELAEKEAKKTKKKPRKKATETKDKSK
jgi:large subunit ribosomal protein L31